MALGIKHIGIQTAELLANRAGNIENVKNFSVEDLLQIDGIGDKVANAVVEYFNEPSNLNEIDRLLSLGVNPTSQKVVSFKGHIFEGKTFVITGTLEHYSRQQASTLIKERGVKWQVPLAIKPIIYCAGKLLVLNTIKQTS